MSNALDERALAAAKRAREIMAQEVMQGNATKLLARLQVVFVDELRAVHAEGLAEGIERAAKWHRGIAEDLHRQADQRAGINRSSLNAQAIEHESAAYSIRSLIQPQDKQETRDGED